MSALVMQPPDGSDALSQLAELSPEVRLDLAATAGKVRGLRRTLSAATAVPVLILLAWPVMMPSLISLLLRLARARATEALKGPLRAAARLPAQLSAEPRAEGALSDLIIVSQARLVVWACLLGPPLQLGLMAAALWWILASW